MSVLVPDPWNLERQKLKWSSSKSSRRSPSQLHCDLQKIVGHPPFCCRPPRHGSSRWRSCPEPQSRSPSAGGTWSTSTSTSSTTLASTTTSTSKSSATSTYCLVNHGDKVARNLTAYCCRKAFCSNNVNMVKCTSCCIYCVISWYHILAPETHNGAVAGDDKTVIRICKKMYFLNFIFDATIFWGLKKE